MSGSQFPSCPPQLKTVQHYLKLATDYESREIVISYWGKYLAYYCINNDRYLSF